MAQSTQQLSFIKSHQATTISTSVFDKQVILFECKLLKQAPRMIYPCIANQHWPAGRQCDYPALPQWHCSAPDSGTLSGHPTTQPQAAGTGHNHPAKHWRRSAVGRQLKPISVWYQNEL